jgi:hypothetical protein
VLDKVLDNGRESGMQPVPSPGMRPVPSPGMRPVPSPGMRPVPSPDMRPVPSPISERLEEIERLEESYRPHEDDKGSEIDESMVQKKCTGSKMGFLAASLKTRSDISESSPENVSDGLRKSPKDKNLETKYILTPQFVSKS